MIALLTFKTKIKMTGIELIAQERKRQQDVEGWTLEHDALHNKGELKAAALCYWGFGSLFNSEDIAGLFPFEKKSWKPKSRIKNLIKAGALYMAENDRTQTNDCGIEISMIAKKIDEHLRFLRGQVYGENK